MRDSDCAGFLQAWLPRLGLRWAGYRKVRRTVCKRLARRLRALGLVDLEAYAARLESSPEERRQFDALCRIPISRCWRDHLFYERLAEAVLPQLADEARRDGRSAVRCWSAGCAAGQEPYGLSIAWRLAVQPAFPRVTLTVTASDADPAALRHAKLASYRAGTLRELPAYYREAAFARDGERFVLRASFREAVSLRLQDIRGAMPTGLFDLVLCRNLVFTYFAADEQRVVLRRLTERLRGGGWLAIGAHEQLPVGTTGFEREAALLLFRKTEPA